MTTNDFKELTRAVVLALREELGLDNKELLEKFSSVEEKLKFDGVDIVPGISAAANNLLQSKPDGLYVSPGNVTTEASPVGEIIAFMGTTAPEHYLACDGAEYTIGTHPHLELFFTTQFGGVNYFGGNGTTTYKVPDLRGEFLRGAGANSRARQGSGGSVGEHQNATELPEIRQFMDKSQAFLWTGAYNSILDTKNADAYLDKNFLGFDRVNLTHIEESLDPRYPYVSTRPTNTSVMYCIKYEPTFVDNTVLSIQRPDLWPESTEIDFGNGLYGFAKCGSISMTANTTTTVVIATAADIANIHNLTFVHTGGWFIDDNGIVGSLGAYSSVYNSALFVERSVDMVKLNTSCGGNRSGKPYFVWMTYTKGGE